MSLQKNKLMLGEQKLTSSLLWKEKYADSISFVFINTGDAPQAFSDREKCQQHLINLRVYGKSRATQSAKKS